MHHRLTLNQRLRGTTEDTVLLEIQTTHPVFTVQCSLQISPVKSTRKHKKAISSLHCHVKNPTGVFKPGCEILVRVK